MANFCQKRLFAFQHTILLTAIVLHSLSYNLKSYHATRMLKGLKRSPLSITTHSIENTTLKETELISFQTKYNIYVKLILTLALNITGINSD